MPRVPLFVWIFVGGFCAVWIAFGSRILPSARTHDFLNLYTGGSLALDGNFAHTHDVDVQLARERRFVPQTDALRPFVRPPFYALMLAPIALLPHPVAFNVWILIQSALLIGCWIWAWRRFGADALVFAALSLPAPLGIASGQDCVQLLVLFIIAYELTSRGKLAAGGAALALMLIKFHLILLWPVALLITRRWRMLAGFCAVAAAEGMLCLALGGMEGVRTYVALLQNKNLDYLSPSKELMINFQGLTENLGISSTTGAAAVMALIFILFVAAVRSAPLWRLFAATATASLLIAPHVYAYDATLLLLPLWLTIFESRWPPSRITATLLCTPIPFGFALAGKPWAIVSSASLLVFLLWLALEGFRSVQDAPSSRRSAIVSSPSVSRDRGVRRL